MQSIEIFTNKVSKETYNKINLFHFASKCVSRSLFKLIHNLKTILDVDFIGDVEVVKIAVVASNRGNDAFVDVFNWFMVFRKCDAAKNFSCCITSGTTSSDGKNSF